MSTDFARKLAEIMDPDVFDPERKFSSQPVAQLQVGARRTLALEAAKRLIDSDLFEVDWSIRQVGETDDQIVSGMFGEATARLIAKNSTPPFPIEPVYRYRTRWTSASPEETEPNAF